MPTLPNKYSTILNAFAHLFSKRIWERVRILLAGAILSPAERTVTAALRAVGLSQEKHFQKRILFLVVSRYTLSRVSNYPHQVQNVLNDFVMVRLIEDVLTHHSRLSTGGVVHPMSADGC